ncbi:MAG TPA: RNA polymerase sigma factor [Gemmatales bacterium]|nr:RNA polymerase sigma factor [Gemmatales bacterium]
MNRLSPELLAILDGLGTAPTLGDAELLDRFLAGDQEAFEVLLRRHGPMVLGVCRRVLGHGADAEDAFQATFLVLVRMGRKVRRPGSLSCWLHGVAWRTSQAARRRRQRRQTRPLAPAPEPAAQEQPPTEPWLDEELRHLPDWLRQPVVLSYLEGLNKAQIAERLRLAEGTVSSRLARAREQLRRRLTRRGLAPAAVPSLLAGAPDLVAAVPTELHAATLRAGQALLGGAALAASGISPHVVALVKGASLSMTLAHGSVLGVALFIASVCGGAGLMVYEQAQAETGSAPVALQDEGGGAAARPVPTAQANAEPEQRGRPRSASELRQRLHQRGRTVFAQGSEHAIGAALQKLSAERQVAIEVDEEAFEDAGLPLWTEETVWTCPDLTDPSLDCYLKRILHTSSATYLVRGDRVVIVPRIYVDEGRHLHVNVRLDARKPVKLPEALDRLADEYGVTIIIDPRVKEEAGGTEVQGNYQAVRLDTVLRLMADMAGLQVVKLRDAYYLTNDEGASRLAPLAVDKPVMP